MRISATRRDAFSSRVVCACGGTFTLLELMLVLMIATLILALVAPRIGRLPAGVVIRKAESDIQAAFQQASLRARAKGTAVLLELDMTQNRLAMKDALSTLDPWQSAVAPEDASGTILSLPPEISWSDDQSVLPEAMQAIFTFMPDGSAAGPDLRYELRGRRFTARLVRITGHLEITELPMEVR